MAKQVADTTKTNPKEPYEKCKKKKNNFLF